MPHVHSYHYYMEATLPICRETRHIKEQVQAQGAFFSRNQHEHRINPYYQPDF